MIDTRAPALPALPPSQRAAQPAARRGVRRDRVRLLVVDRRTGELLHSRFDRLPELLGPGDLLVVNTSRVLPAAVAAVRASGELVQLRPCVRRPGRWDALAVQPETPHANVSLEPGERLRVGGARLRVAGRRPDIPLLWQVELEGAAGHDDLDLILRNGRPIRYSYVPQPVPLDAYQPVYASHPGSAESPSAGLPFSWALLRAARERGAGLADLVLHTGLSSYQDDDFDLEHYLFEEWFEIGEATAEAINAAARVIAVGTTVVRALETAAGDDGGVRPMRGWTRLQIGPHRPPRAVDALLTGMHEPQASHFDLLRAFLPEALLARAYREAIASGYLWHEFGDAALVL
ncbi:MAG TPA: S-adenosylmethionine:tRNA ribosyltransferase-isomerase [Candidatus Dormibacteraeota bacterium]|nr:S-adenosylmethionine:tRNA ribosyltransferase-isomerase [Candidatus Dormibacteraeota bacterium]